MLLNTHDAQDALSPPPKRKDTSCFMNLNSAVAETLKSFLSLHSIIPQESFEIMVMVGLLFVMYFSPSLDREPHEGRNFGCMANTK